MRIAIIHDWLVVYAGAERVLEQILACYPDVDLFSLVDFLPTDQRAFIRNKPAKSTTQSHRVPIYYVDLMTLRAGVDNNEASGAIY